MRSRRMPGQLDIGAERLTEEISLAGCIGNFDLRKRWRFDADPKPCLKRAHLESGDGLGVGAVQSLGNPKNAAQPRDEPAIRPSKIGQILVSLPGEALR